MFKKNSRRGFSRGLTFGRLARPNLISVLVVVSLVATMLGCRTAPTLRPVNLATPGWTTREGQAVWRPRTGAPEIAGDLTVATRPDGSSFVQFTKTPIPFVVARAEGNAWQIHFVPGNKTYSGHGRPPGRIGWLQLPTSLAGVPPPKPWQWQMLGNNNWRLSNPTTGESLEGYL